MSPMLATDHSHAKLSSANLPTSLVVTAFSNLLRPHAIGAKSGAPSEALQPWIPRLHEGMKPRERGHSIISGIPKCHRTDRQGRARDLFTARRAQAGDLQDRASALSRRSARFGLRVVAEVSVRRVAGQK
jgi:hypothetical protein